VAHQVVLCGLQLCLLNIRIYSKIPLNWLTWGQICAKLLNMQDYHVVPILTKAITGNFLSLLLHLGHTTVSEKYSIWIILSAGSQSWGFSSVFTVEVDAVTDKGSGDTRMTIHWHLWRPFWTWPQDLPVSIMKIFMEKAKLLVFELLSSDAKLSGLPN